LRIAGLVTFFTRGQEAVLADGMICEAERAHLVQTLQELLGSSPDDIAEPTHAAILAFA
jgi:hypothetical protein